MKIKEFISRLIPFKFKKYHSSYPKQDFFKTLRLNTQSPYGDPIQQHRDRKIGRRNLPDLPYMIEYSENLVLLKSSFLNSKDDPPGSYTAVYFKDKSFFYLVSFPGFVRLILLFGILFLKVMITLYLNLWYLALSSTLLILFNFWVHDETEEHYALIDKIVKA